MFKLILFVCNFNAMEQSFADKTSSLTYIKKYL